MPEPVPIPVAILAAGASRRLGRPKQLARLDGRSLLARAIDAAIATPGAGPMFVVVGSGGPEIRAEAGRPGVAIVENPAWESGMASSVRAAVAAIESGAPGASAALFLVCDQPNVTPDLLGAILRAHRDGAGLVASAYDGAVGVPALFARGYFEELGRLEGDAGARRVLARHAGEVHAVDFPGGGLDIDTPADLGRWAGAGGG